MHRSRAIAVGFMVLACALFTLKGTPAAETMRAVVVIDGQPQLRQIPIPAVEDGYVRIKVRAVSVNPADWKYARDAANGHVAGADVAGIIDAVGRGVSHWRPGMAVIGIARKGSYAEYALLEARLAASKPTTLSFEESAGLPIACETAWRSVVTLGDVKEGQRVLILGGAGGVGSCAIQIAKARGARVVATASTRNEAFLHSIGAEEVIDYHTTAFEDRVQNADMVLNTVDPETSLRAMRVIKPGGILVSVVGPPQEPMCVASHIRCAVPGHSTGEMLPNVVALADAGKLRINIDQRLPLSDVAKAWELSRAKHTRGKIILDVDTEGH